VTETKLTLGYGIFLEQAAISYRGKRRERFADYPHSTPARGRRNQEKVILGFRGYFLISAGQFCTRVKGWFSSFTSPVLMRNFWPSAVTV
jgi:hypothetical protein